MIRGPFGTEPWWPSDIFSSRKKGFRRLQTEDGDTAQNEGRVFRISRELSFSDTPFVIRFTSPIDFKIRFQSLSVDTGGIVMRAYRDGTESGAWTPVNVFGTNAASFVPSYTRQIAVDSGGAVTPVGPSAETLRVRTSGATAQKTTVSASGSGDRLLGAGTYYLVFSRLADVTGTVEGVYTLRYEEFPQSAQ